MKTKYYWVVLAAISALLIFFFMGASSLRFYFALLFFLILVSLQRFLFHDEESNAPSLNLLKSKRVRRFYPMFPYVLGAAASLIVASVPSLNVKIYHNCIFTTYLSLPPMLFVRAVLGIFLLSFFPGYIVYKSFFGRNSFFLFEKIGLVLALSYCINTLLGLILFRAGVALSQAVIVVSMWVLVFAIEIAGRFLKKDSAQTPSSEHTLTDWEAFLLSLTSLTLLIGLYVTVLSRGPLSGITSGDVPDYMTYANEFFHLNLSINTPGLGFYLVIGQHLCGLPMIYVYAILQYMVLLVPISVHAFMKQLFPQQRKVATIGTLMISLIMGLTSLPFLTHLIGSPSLFNKFINEGNVWLAIQEFGRLGAANTGIYLLQSSTVEAGLFVFAIAFLYNYLSAQGEEKRLTNLFFGALFLGGALFTHHIFLLLCFVGTVAIFSLLQNVSKQRLVETIGTVALFSLLFDFLSNSPVGGLFQVFYLEYTFFQTEGGRTTFLYGAFFLVLLSAYLILLFRVEIGRKLGLTKHPRLVKRSFQTLRKLCVRGQFWLWMFGLSLLFLSFYFCYLNYDSINIKQWDNPLYIRPWYLYGLYFGLAIPLIIGTLPRILKKCNETPMKFILSWMLSIVGLVSFFNLFYSPYAQWARPSVFIKRYLLHMSYPLSCLAALGLSTLFQPMARVRARINWKDRKALGKYGKRVPAIKVNTARVRARKIRNYVLPTFLIFSIAASFLSFAYVFEYWHALGANLGFGMSSSDAEALEWMYNNLPKNSVVVALSSRSYEELCSVFSDKILPIPLERGSTWPRNILVKSQLPEAVLYGLDQLEATHIFVGSRDEGLLSRAHPGGTLVSLIRTFPLVYSRDDTKIYKVPKYPLYEDSNYHIVSGMWNFPEWKSEEVMEQPNLLEVSKVLIGGEVPYSIISDTELRARALTSGHVYIFPYNQRVPQSISTNLTSFMSDGAHVIFTDLSFASFTEIGQVLPLKLDIKTYNRTLASPQIVSEIVFDEKIINCSLPILEKVHFENESQLETIASFRLSDGSLEPYIVRERVGDGSITFLNIHPLKGIPVPLQGEILNWTRNSIFKYLPIPVQPKTPISLPIPHDLYTAFQGSTVELWRNRDLFNKLLFQDDITVYGNFAITSDHVYFSSDQLLVKEMRIVKSGKVITIRDAVLHDVRVVGSGRLASRESQGLVYNYPGGLFTVINVTDNSSKDSEHSINLTNAQMAFKENLETEEQAYLGYNVTLTTSASSYTLRAEQPTLTVNGVFESTLQGAFLHEDFFFRAFSLSRASFAGDLTLKILYSSGIMIAQMREIKNLEEMDLKFAS